MKTYKAIVILFLLLSSIAQANTCDHQTSPSHWFYKALSAFIEADGCAIQGASLKTPLIQAPFFVISKLNSTALKPIERPMDLSIFQIDSPVRSTLETLKENPSVLMVIAPMTDGTGIVFTQETDGEVLAEIKSQFQSLPGIEKVKTVFVLGNAAQPLTVVHENKHVQDILDGKLPLKSMFESLLKSLDLKIANRGNVSAKEIEILKNWLTSALRTTPEVSAVLEEYRYLNKQGSFKGSFLSYLRASEHDYINKHLGLFWLNESIKADSDTEFLKAASGEVCGFLSLSFKKLALDEFGLIYPNCALK